jgi:hypothetical protein
MRSWFTVMWAGFWLNALTGLLLFAADPRTTRLFVIKMVSVIAGVSLIMLTRRAVYPRGSTVATVPPVARAYAILSLVTWTVATTTGRLMAYL